MDPSDHAGRLPGDEGRRAGAWVAAAAVLIVAVAGSLIVPVYARTEPMLGGFPFFYWYQLLLVPVIAVVSWLGVRHGASARSASRPAPPAI